MTFSSSLFMNDMHVLATELRCEVFQLTLYYDNGFRVPFGLMCVDVLPGFDFSLNQWG